MKGIRSIVLFGGLADPSNPFAPGLGDLISRNAFTKVLAETYPAARITFVAGPRLVRRFREYLLNHAYIDDVIECPELGAATFRQWLSFWNRMRKRRFDLCVVDPSSSAVRPLHAYLCGIPERIGVPASPTDFRLLTTRVELRATPPRAYPDSMDVTAAFVRAIGVTRELSVRDLIPRFPYKRAAEPRSAQTIVAVHAGGDCGWNRRWPLESFQLLCERLCREAAVAVHLVGGADEWTEIDKVRAAVIQAFPAARILNLSGGTLNDMAQRLDQASLFIGNDSAPMHIAAALGKPVIVMCGPVGAGLWERMYSAHIVSIDTECKKRSPFSDRRHRERQHSCAQFNCPYSFDRENPAYPKCLADIGVDQVWAAVTQHLPVRQRSMRHRS